MAKKQHFFYVRFFSVKKSMEPILIINDIILLAKLKNKRIIFETDNVEMIMPIHDAVPICV